MTRYIASSPAAFGDDLAAALLYDTETVPVPGAPAVAHLIVEDGKIPRVHETLGAVAILVRSEAARGVPTLRIPRPA